MKLCLMGIFCEVANKKLTKDSINVLCTLTGIYSNQHCYDLAQILRYMIL
jgi:hypothetical protein